MECRSPLSPAPNRPARVRSLQPGAFRRIIAVSDLHGNDALFDRLLGQVRFSDADALVLLGDYIERGEQTLPLLRRIMRLCARGNVFPLLGNCDTLLDDLFEPRFRGDLTDYLGRHPQTILHEMLAEQGLRFSAGTTLDALRSLVRGHYAAEYAFLASLPHVIAAGDTVFVHAGLDAAPLEQQEDDRCMKRSDFYRDAPAFPFLLVVGHRPCQCIRPEEGGAPVHDAARNILFLDGGVSVCTPCRLNALVLEGETLSIHSVSP